MLVLGRGQRRIMLGLRVTLVLRRRVLLLILMKGVAIQLPIGQEDTFRGIVDLVDMNAEVYYDDMGNDMRTEPIPEDMVEQAEEYRNILVEAVAENDEELMEKYLEGEEITREELKKAIRKETIANTLVPVVCGSSYKNRGVQKPHQYQTYKQNEPYHDI